MASGNVSETYKKQQADIWGNQKGAAVTVTDTYLSQDLPDAPPNGTA